jgi:cell surface protein SprA
MAWLSVAKENGTQTLLFHTFNPEEADSTEALKPKKKTRRSTYKDKDRYGDAFSNKPSKSPLLLKDPSNIKKEVEIGDDSAGSYHVTEKIGDTDYRSPSEMSYEEFEKHRQEEAAQKYWKNKKDPRVGDTTMGNARLVPKIVMSPTMDRIFGGNVIDIKPNGNVMLDFGGQFQRVDNPATPVRLQRMGQFIFNQTIQLNVQGKVGEKLKLGLNWDTKATFDFENNLKIDYNGLDYEIIKKIDAGNISFPLNSQLIQGSQNLFGVRADLQFGKLWVSAVAANQRGKSDELVIQNNAQNKEIEFRADNYEDNRHYFLAQYFRNNYELALQNLPNINSGIKISNVVDVYVTNRNNTTDGTRNIIALMDLGENTPYDIGNSFVYMPGNSRLLPDNNSNNIYSSVLMNNAVRNVEMANSILEGYGLQKVAGFETVKSARKLILGKDYTLNAQLGYISLNSPLRNDDVLAVAYNYTDNFTNAVHKVGETSDQLSGVVNNEAIILKLLRPTTIRTDLPMWNLQMKNIYNINQSNVSKKNFQFRIIYKDDASGIDNPSIHEGTQLANKPLLQVFNLDRLNQNNDPQPDGNFDFIAGTTIDTSAGRIIFPVLEPFGAYLASKFDTTEVNLIEKYAFKEIYRKTKSDLLNLASKNKFFLRVASSSSSSSDIALPGLNISRGSVRITAGSTPLTEGTDYTVNYEQGRIKILNEGVMASAREIRIKYEKADLFNFRQKSLTGARFDYKYNKDIVLGGTILHLNERPLITRVSIGDEPVSNTIVGLDLSYQRESRTITKLIDKLPLIVTKVPSNVALQGEYAAFIPGSSSLIGSSGTAYLDDFEGAENPFDLTRSPTRWKLGSTPITMSNLGTGQLEFGYKRAKLAWYMIDNVFYTDGGANKPANISSEDIKNHYVRAVLPQEIYPNRDQQQAQLNEPVFDLNFYPAERGPYNYNPNLNPDGTINGDPKLNFGSITRSITTDTDFDNANIQYLEFWLMDPFIGDKSKHGGIPVKNKAGTADSLIYNTTGGKMYIHLGNVSEDVLKDGQQSFENGLPAPGLSTAASSNIWGKIPQGNYINDAFAATTGARSQQDIGLDGVKNTEEATFYATSFIDKIPDASKNAVLKDPSADDFVHYLDNSNADKNYKIIDRYKHYNGLENNSPENTGGESFTPSSTNSPDNEDLNQNNTINDLEQYFEYEIDLSPNQLQGPNKYIIAKEVSIQNEDSVAWYQFRIPIRDPNAKNINNITDLKSIRYLRMNLTGWSQPVALRMAQLQLVAGQWRTFFPSTDLDEKTAEVKPEPINTAFNISTVNIEENSTGTSTTSGYTVPPGFIRDRDNTSNVSRRLNEQSLRMCVDNLGDGKARAVFKNTNFNFMNYGKLQMFIHAESANLTNTSFTDTTLRAFIRLGTDFTQNYYEIEVPLVYTRNPTIDDNEIWRWENNVDISFDALSGVKAARNRIGAYDQRIAFSRFVENRNVSIVGNPDLSSIQVLMLGLKNPITKDQNPYSACVWMNEFRVTDFVNNTGHAAIGRANAKLADFATVSLSGKYMGIGFGSIDQKISQRNLNEQIDYGVQSNVSLDKLIPEKAGLKIPLFVSYDRSTSTPKYDPTNPDIKLDASLASVEDPVKRESLRQILIDQSTKRSINITNLSKVKTGKNPKSHIYDVENLSVSASYSDGIRTSYMIAENTTLQYKAGIRYNFTGSPKNLEPLKGLNLKSPYLALIKDINMTLMPAMLSFTADVNRSYNKMQNRNSFLGIDGVDPQYQKAFTFNRTYGLNWALTKSLSLNYGANVLAIIDEEFGEINTPTNNKKIEGNLKKGGRLQRFDQNIGFNYKIPFNKLPLTDWLSADTRYVATYLWQGASLATADSLGNTITNSAEKSVNGKIDLTKLYNKVKFLKEINSPTPPKKPDPKDTIKPKPELKLVKGIFRILMTAKSINFTYSLKQGTAVPGFRPKPVYVGMSNHQESDGSYAPGLPFLLGSQDLGPFLDKAAANQWISTNPNMSSQMGQNYTENITLRTTLEPFKDFKVQLDAKRDRTGLYTETYRYDKNAGEFLHYSPVRSGSFNISFISIKTSFINDNSGNASSVFETFRKNREIIKSRLTTLNENSTSAQYNINSQDVLIPAFIAAYTGTDVNTTKLTSFPKIPLPNWQIDYSGLSNLDLVKKFFSTVSLTHKYSSIYSIGAYNNSNLYDNTFIGLEHSELDQPLASKFSSSLNTSSGSAIFNPIYVIAGVSIKEAFSPLLGVNMKTKKNVTIKLEYRKTRDINLSLSNFQVTELGNNEVVIGLGFTKANYKIPFTKDFVLKNDITFRFDTRISDTKTTQRTLEGLNSVTSGNLLISIKPNISYVVNQRLNLQFYFDHTINSPKVSNSFYRTNTLFGIQVRFTLS